MGSDTRSNRSYRSPSRQRQAASTRAAILGAAQAAFEQNGYAAVTMAEIAAKAEVSLKTVYLACATKAGLLRAVWDMALKGDIDDAPVAERPWYVEVLAESDPERKLRRLAQAACIVKRRIGVLLGVIRDAASVDAEIADLWTLIQTDFHANQRAIVATLDAAGTLAPGLDVERATDILWTLNHPDVWLLLVGQRRWTPEQFEAWFAETAIDQLVRGR